MINKSPLPAILLCLLLVGCTDGVLTFPEPSPATTTIVNVTDDVDTLNVVVDATTQTTAMRGDASAWVPCPSGRPVGFVLKDNEKDLRDTVFYTLGGSAKVILFTYGSRRTTIEFRRGIQDTTLPADADPVIRFTHMAQNVNQFATLEVWITGGARLLPDDFDPGLTSQQYTSIAPGTYSFEVREYQTNNVAAVITNVTLVRGKSYMLYTWDAKPPQVDSVALSIL